VAEVIDPQSLCCCKRAGTRAGMLFDYARFFLARRSSSPFIVGSPTPARSRMANAFGMLARGREPRSISPSPRPTAFRLSHLRRSLPNLRVATLGCAHHLRFARPRGRGRRVSDEFTVPLRRSHHRALHRHGDEAEWPRTRTQIVPALIVFRSALSCPLGRVDPGQSGALHFRGSGHARFAWCLRGALAGCSSIGL
jgi:hypothetical protein